MHERGSQVYRSYRRLIVTGDKTNYRLMQKLLHLAQIEINLFAPAIDHDSYLLTWVTKPVEDLKGALGAANRRNIQGQDQHDFVRLIECRKSNRIEGMLRVQNYVVVGFAQTPEDLKYMFGFDFIGRIGLFWRRE